MANITLPFGASADRRAPTVGELLAGFACGPADQELFNWLLHYATSRVPWVPVLSIDTLDPPGAPTIGDAYIVPASATGDWAGQSQKVAEWTGGEWSILDTPNGHGVSLPNGRVFIKQGGLYAEFPGGDALTLYVRTDGDDDNDGLTNNAAGAFKTLQGAITFAMGRYGPGGKPIKLILGISGTYVTPSLPAGSAITIEGSMSSWAGFILTNGGTARSAISINNSYLSLRGVCIQTDSAGRVVIDATNGGVVDLNTVRVTEGSGLANTLIRAAYGAVVRLIDVIQLYADASYAIGVTGGTVNGVVGGTITFYTTPDYSGATVSVSHAGACYLSGVTVAGAATGKRYWAQLNGVIDTGGGGANFIPGNVAGTQTSGGQYA